MADIRAFRGLRYDLGRVGDLQAVIAPPYDVIDSDLSARLHAQSGHNVIRLILDPILPTDTDEDNRYTRSAKRLKEWRTQGFVVEERERAVYAYEQSFDWEGRTYKRRGFMARCRLEKFGEGTIYPHEETIASHKVDRLKLFHATGMNLSQIFGLYPDDAGEVNECLELATRGMTPLEATDHLGVEHRLWPIVDQHVIGQLQSLLSPKPVFIADGHHRYETGCQHLADRQAADKVSGAEDPANFILMMFVAMTDPGLRIMPTHRLVRGLTGLTVDALVHALARHFVIQRVGSGATAVELAWDFIEGSGRQDRLAFNVPAEDIWITAELKTAASMDEVVSDHSAEWKSLGVAILHRLVLDHCLKSFGEAKCNYVHLLSEVVDAVAANSCDLACLVHPATVEDIRVLAGKFERMPAKSTYFYPKLACGLVFNPIQ